MRLEVSETARLRLLEESDAAELHALIEANRARLAQWLPWAAGQAFEDTLAFIQGTRRQLADNDGFQAAIVCDERIAGVIGYVRVDWANRSTSLGYWLDERQEGRGTMTAAASALVDHALRGWQLNRVEIRAATENHRSRAIPERLGFRQEGTLRERKWSAAVASTASSTRCWRQSGARCGRSSPQSSVAIASRSPMSSSGLSSRPG